MFQFYLSSIKSFCSRFYIFFRHWFQFYLSSIKRKNLLSYFPQWKSFNSTLVQLKVCIHKQIDVRIHSFNSTLVQLKGFNSASLAAKLLSFNSTLVQLKVSRFH